MCEATTTTSLVGGGSRDWERNGGATVELRQQIINHSSSLPFDHAELVARTIVVLPVQSRTSNSHASTFK
jgi:hypothetical protein